MDKDLIRGIKFGTGILLVFLVAFTVYAVGFHHTSEVLPGTFQGNYFFEGNLSIGKGKDSSYSLYIENNKSPMVLFNGTSNATHTGMNFVNNHGKKGSIKLLRGGLPDKKGELLLQTYDNRSINFRTSKNQSPSYDMIIDEEGDVGIGTVNPQTDLHVDGLIRMRSAHYPSHTCEGSIRGSLFYDVSGSSDSICVCIYDGNDYRWYSLNKNSWGSSTNCE